MKAQALFFLILLATSCGSYSGNAKPVGSASSNCGDASTTKWREEGSSVPTSMTCLVRRTNLVLVGEVHGTNEIPRFVGKLVAQASHGRPVILGLERDAKETSVTNHYLRDSKGVEAKNQMLSTGEWARGLTDGRSSGAMAKLLATIRQLRLKGADINVVLMERPPAARSQIMAAGGIQAYVDQSMANVARQALMEGKVGTLFVGYMGELHAMPSPDAASSHQGSVSDRLADLRPLVILANGNGHAWNCTITGCGVHSVAPPAEVSVWGSRAIDVRRIVFSSLTASSPATPH